MIEKMRKDFESWIEKETGFNTFRTNFPMTKPEDQQYKCHHTNLAWLAWQASSAADKDAARYRWLRDEAADADQTSPLVFMADECADIVTDGDYQGIMFGKLLDAAIDEAMQCK